MAADFFLGAAAVFFVDAAVDDDFGMRTPAAVLAFLGQAVVLPFLEQVEAAVDGRRQAVVDVEGQRPVLQDIFEAVEGRRQAVVDFERARPLLQDTLEEVDGRRQAALDVKGQRPLLQDIVGVLGFLEAVEPRLEQVGLASDEQLSAGLRDVQLAAAVERFVDVDVVRAAVARAVDDFAPR